MGAFQTVFGSGDSTNVITIEGVDATDYFDAKFAALAGVGIRTVTLEVSNGTINVQSARVRLTSDLGTFTATTDANGLVTFNLDDDDYIAAVVAAGHSYNGSTITVDSDETFPVVLTPIPTVVSDPGFVTGCWECFVDGSTSEGVEVSLRFARFDRSDIGKHHSKAVRKILSDASGQACFSNMFPGATYEVWTKSEQLRSVVTVPKTATGTIQLGSFSD